MRSVHIAMALVVSQQLHSCRRLRMLQRRVAVKRLLGWIQSCLVDSWSWLLQWTCWSEWALGLWGAVLELCRYYCCGCWWASSQTCTNACTNTCANACTSAHTHPHARTHANADADTCTSTIASAYTYTYACNGL